MGAPVPILIERFRRLARSSHDTWQGGLVTLPGWIDGPDGTPFRLRAGLWISSRTGRIHLVTERPDEATVVPDPALTAFLEFGLNRKLAGQRPSRVEVTDPALAERIRTVIADPELDIAVVDALPAIRHVLRAMAEDMTEGPIVPDAVDAPGVTVDRMRAFAEAAKAFYEAAPWRHLDNDDLIEIAASAIGPDLRYCVVMGAGRQVYGLAFFGSRDDFEKLAAGPAPEEFSSARQKWAVHFNPLWELPFGDADLWEAHGLPVADPSAYPCAVRTDLDSSTERPDAAHLATMEGLLRALAQTSEQDLDRGRWTASVATADGARTFELALPDLDEAGPPARARRPITDRRVMERASAEMQRFMASRDFADLDEVNRAFEERFSGRPLDDIPSTATTPLERAQDLMYEAFDARGRRQIQLARRALALSPDCADAYVLLAERAWGPEEARRLYTEGVAAGERALGLRFFADEVGHFWDHIQARPYMRARFGLAQELEAAGSVDQAVEHYRTLLHLDAHDHQGVRYQLLALLLREGRDEQAGSLLSEHGHEITALWSYGWVLWAFKLNDLRQARRLLKSAVRANPHVPGYLTAPDEMPDLEVPHYALGSEEEAFVCVAELGEAWQRTPGAVDWLEAETRSMKRTRRPKRKGR